MQCGYGVMEYRRQARRTTRTSPLVLCIALPPGKARISTRGYFMHSNPSREKEVVPEQYRQTGFHTAKEREESLVDRSNGGIS